MKWICLNCGRKNDQYDQKCTKCGLDQEIALTSQISRRRKTCEECGHRHREDTYCHVYSEAGDEDGVGDYISEGEEEESEAESTDSEDQVQILKAKKDTIRAKTVNSKKPAKLKPLKTPDYVKAIRYIRCNCNVGIPNDSSFYEPIPPVLMCERIQILTYNELNDHNSKQIYQEHMKLRFSEQAMAKMYEEKIDGLTRSIPTIMSFLPYGLCSPIPQVCRYWNNGANLYKEYIDIRDCVPYQVFRPHSGRLESILINNNKVYSGGDHRLYASDSYTGEILSTITRDSGEITRLYAMNGDLFACSSNGSVRSYMITHSGQNMKMTATMWDHTRSIMDILPSLPSEGVCPMHGIDNHICALYSASQDRSIKIWNLSKNSLLRTVTAKSLRFYSFTRLAQSDRHLFAGTTGASIAVFSKYNFCEREDLHACSMINSEKSYCLQLTLKLPQRLQSSGNLPMVTGLLCPKIGPEFPTLWAADSSGQLTIWYIPASGLEYIPAYTLVAHQGAINAITHTWRHVITVGDDGFIRLFDVLSFATIKQIDVMYWCAYRSLLSNPHIKRKIKVIHVQENYDSGGQIVVGTTYGDIILLSLGTTV